MSSAVRTTIMMHCPRVPAWVYRRPHAPMSVSVMSRQRTSHDGQEAEGNDAYHIIAGKKITHVR